MDGSYELCRILYCNNGDLVDTYVDVKRKSANDLMPPVEIRRVGDVGVFAIVNTRGLVPYEDQSFLFPE